MIIKYERSSGENAVIRIGDNPFSVYVEDDGVRVKSHGVSENISVDDPESAVRKIENRLGHIEKFHEVDLRA